MNFKKRIMLSDLSRKDIARQLDMSYMALTSRLNNFTPFQPDEERRLCQILDEAERSTKTSEKK